MVKKIKVLSEREKFDICNKNFTCKCCELRYRGWCVFKNTKEQLELNLTKKEYENYMNKEVTVYEKS